MSNKNLPPVTIVQLERMDAIKALAIEADKAILPTTKAKLAKQSLEQLFELTRELIIQHGQLVLCTGLEQTTEGVKA